MYFFSTNILDFILFFFTLFVQQFKEAAEKVKKLAKQPTDDELKEIYSLFKQATVGDVNTGQFLVKVPALLCRDVSGIVLK